MKEFAKRFYKSKAWLECRKGYIQSVNGICESCLAKGIFKPGKIVHHKILLTPQNIDDPEVSLNWDHLEYQCQECHNIYHNSNSVTREGLVFDCNGDLIEVK